MRRFFADPDEWPSDDPEAQSKPPHPLTTALLAFDACRSEAAQETGFVVQPLRVSEPAVMRREPHVHDEITRIHDALPESEQLRIYRFYLTAVHRNSVEGSRFEPHVLSSLGRSAATEAEFDDITHEIDELVGEVATHSLDVDATAARLFAADFLWVTAWWVHARQDVVSFVFDSTQDPFVRLLLGRGPDHTERIGRDIYRNAAAAELEYRNHVTATVGSPRNRSTGEHRSHSRARLDASMSRASRHPLVSDECHL